ncbi:MAG: hypothetical protein U1E73_06235 [Planctomycetota bacterium]
MTRFQAPCSSIALCALAAIAPAQSPDADQGMFAGTAGVLSVDSGTGLPGRLYLKAAGYSATFPPEPAPVADGPDFRVAALLYAQSDPPLGALEIDAFSIGRDWIVSNAFGETFGPEGRFAAVLFSVTRSTTGAAGGLVAAEYGNGQDRAAGDVFCYEFDGNSTVPLSREALYRALDSTDIDIRPGAGVGNITAFDVYAAEYATAELAAKLPKGPTVYFSVTAATAPNVPLSWCGNVPIHRSGATVFQATWQPKSRIWNRPSVYLAATDLLLAPADDVDALAVDTAHHDSHYILFSTANPPPAMDRIRFLNRGTGYVDTYRFGNGGPTVESRLGLGGGDIDALCAGDPGADAQLQARIGVETIAPPGWPVPTSWPPTNAPSCFVTRVSGSNLLFAFGASGNPAADHDWYVFHPDPPLGPSLQGPFTIPSSQRQASWKGTPSVFAWPMTPGATNRVGFGVIENGVGSRFVGITEWSENVTDVAAPAVFADAEGSTSANIWRAGSNRVQCLFDTSNFTHQGIDHPVAIDLLEWRQAGGLTGAAVTYPSVNLYLGYAATDHLSPSTTFAGNRTASHTLVHSGQVEVQPAWGTTPNRYTIRVPLATPFVFDPSLGQDLLLEIEIQGAPSPLLASTMSTSFDASAHAANTVRSVGSTTAPTGSISAFCPVCRFGYQELPGTAVTIAYGAGCYESVASFYELFAGGAFDLGGWPVNSIVLTPASGGYAVSAGSNAWHAPTGSGLGLGDDESATVSLPSPFVLPSGPSTSVLTVFSNGFVTPGHPANLFGDPPTANDLLQGPPRHALCWADLLPDGLTNVANVYADYESGTNTFYVTWLGVPTFVSGGQVTMQLAFDLSAMTVEYRWLSCHLPSPAMVAWTPGFGAMDAGGRDLSDLPFATAQDRPALHVDAAPRAILGSTVTFMVSNIDQTALFSAALMNIGGVDAGIDLGWAGMPGCTDYVDLPNLTALWLFGSPTATRFFAVPNAPGLAGLELDNQAASFVPGVNALGAVTSNGLVTRIGLR